MKFADFVRREKEKEISSRWYDEAEKRSLLPRKCYVSNKPLLFKKCVRLRRWVSGPGTPVLLEYWIDEKEFLMLQLAGKINNGSYDFWGP